MILMKISCLMMMQWVGFGLASNVVYTKLVTDLFGNYTKEIRPATNYLAATRARLSMEFTTIHDLDEKNQIFVSAVVIVIEYIDEYLAWDKNNYQGIDYLIYPQKELWLPDLVVENSVDKLSPLGYDEMNVRIKNTGKILWTPSEVLRTTCEVDVTYYPFDTQTCSIILTTWMSQTKDINLKINQDNMIRLSRYQENGAWELVKVDIVDVSGSAAQNRIAFDFTIKRRKTYYVVNLIVPVVSLCATASLVFALPADAGEKIGMSITVLLAYAVYLTIISESMPKTSLQVSIMGVYLSLLLAATAMAVVFSVVVLNIHHKDECLAPGRKWRRFVLRLRPFIGLRDLRKLMDSKDDRCTMTITQMKVSEKPKEIKQSFRNNKVGDVHTLKLPKEMHTDRTLHDPVVYNETIATDSVDVSWKHVSETVDRLLFILFSLFTAVSSIVFVMLLTFGSP